MQNYSLLYFCFQSNSSDSNANLFDTEDQFSKAAVGKCGLFTTYQEDNKKWSFECFFSLYTISLII